MNCFIHATADVHTKDIGRDTRIWQYVVVLAGAKIGMEANICSHCFIENDVRVGNRVTVKSGVQLWDGIRLEDDVFIGPNVTFTNDRYPRSKDHPPSYPATIVEKGASIGGGAVLLPGIVVGKGSIVGAGSVVTRSVPPHVVVVGNPAGVIRKLETD